MGKMYWQIFKIKEQHKKLGQEKKYTCFRKRNLHLGSNRRIFFLINLNFFESLHLRNYSNSTFLCRKTNIYFSKRKKTSICTNKFASRKPP